MADNTNITPLPVVDPSTVQAPLTTIETAKELKLYAIPNQNPVLLNVPNEQDLIDLINNQTINNSTFVTSIQNLAGGTPAGSNTDIQYNNGGSFGAATSGHLEWIDDSLGNSYGEIKVNNWIEIGDVTGHGGAPGIKAVDQTGNSLAGLSFTIAGSDADTGFNGGTLNIEAGSSPSSGVGGTITMQGGRVIGTGGYISMAAGNGDTTAGTGGALELLAGGGGASSGQGGDIDIVAGESQSADVAGVVTISGGLGGTTSDGGDVVLEGGLPQGTGLPGRIVIRAASGNANAYRVAGALNTTDGSYHSVTDVFAMTSGSAGYIRANVVGHRTGGSAGTANDSFAAEFVVGSKNVAGTASFTSAITYVHLFGDNGAVDAKFIVSGGSVLMQVKGDTNNNYSWNYELWYMNV